MSPRATVSQLERRTRPANPLLQGGTPGDRMRSVANVLQFLRESTFELDSDEGTRGLGYVLEMCAEALKFEL